MKMLGSFLLAGLAFASLGHASVAITGLLYTGSGNVSTLVDGFAGIGVTVNAAGDTSQPFLNNLADKSLPAGVGFGSYLTFNPAYFSIGESQDFFFYLADGATTDTALISSASLPDLSTGGHVIGQYYSAALDSTVTLTTTGYVADRVQLGGPPTTFTPDFVNDTVLQLDFVTGDATGPAAVPEPGTLALLIGPALFWLGRRRRAARN
jgi:hypothetical protein